MNKQLILCNLAWLTFTAIVIGYTGNANTARMDAPHEVKSPPPACPDDYVSFMSPQFMLEGIGRYKKYQWDADNQALKTAGKVPASFEDARSCWYSLDRLKNLICLTEKNALDSNWSTSELGIRFYYATYPENEQQEIESILHNPPIPGQINFRPTKADVGWHHTLFMIPTHFDRDTHLNEDIFLVRKAVSGGKPGIFRIQESNVRFTTTPNWAVLLNQKSNTLLRVLALGEPLVTDPSGKNQGMLCPPSCIGATATLSLADAQKVQ